MWPTRFWIPLLLPGVLVAAAACRTSDGVAFTARDHLGAGEREIDVEYTELDRGVAGEVGAATSGALERVRRWGDLRAPVTIRIYPDHASLERAISRDDYGWLRAWAQYRVIYLQSPRTWSMLGASNDEVEELLAHEMTHCLMYQLAATEADWSDKEIPIWFREGMASVTARQDRRRGDLKDLARILTRGGDDPLRQADALYQRDADAVYSSAHHAFAFLAERYHDSAVRQILSRMRGGADFAGAFRGAVGISADDFEAEFERYVRTQGWSASRR